MRSTIEWYRHPEDPAPGTLDLLVYTKFCKIYKGYWSDKTEKFLYEHTIDEIPNVILWAYIPTAVYPTQIISSNEACDALLRHMRK